MKYIKLFIQLCLKDIKCNYEEIKTRKYYDKHPEEIRLPGTMKEFLKEQEIWN